MPQNIAIRKKQVIHTLLLFLCILVVLQVLWYLWMKSSVHPTINDGELNLRNYELTNKDILLLDGEWIFYPNQLLSDSGDPDTTAHQLISVPGDWQGAFEENTKKGYRYGTFHLKIHLPEMSEKIYSLKIPSISSASKVFVNGELIGEQGEIGKAKDVFSANSKSYTVNFTSATDKLDVMIQVANQDHALFGGMNDSVKFGSQLAINQQNTFLIAIQLIMVLIFFLYSIYSIAQYIMGRRHHGFLNYTIVMFFVSIAILFDDDQLFLSILPLHAEWASIFRDAAYLLFALFNLRFVSYLFPGYANPLIQRCLFIIGIFLFVLAIALPNPYSFHLLSWVGIFMAFIFIYVSIILVKVSLFENQYKNILLFTAASIFTTVIWRFLFAFPSIEGILYPFNMVFALSSFGLFLLKRSIIEEKENKMMNQQLQKINKLKDHFTTSTSHELRNLLHSITNISEVILKNEDKTLTKESLRDLSFIITMGRNIDTKLSAIKEVTQLHVGELSLNKKPVSLQAITLSTTDMLQHLLKEKNIVINMDIPNHFPNVYADENRLSYVFFQIIMNAIRYTEQGKITFSAIIQNDNAIISISDTGIGIESDTLKQIFHTEQYKNTRIDLSICKILLEMHGGELQIISERNEGTTVNMTIPLHNEKEMEINKAHLPNELLTFNQLIAKTSAEHSNKPRLLIVNNDAVVKQQLQDFLGADYEIVIAQNAEEALSHVQIFKLDLIIIDVLLPEMSGYQLTKIIRKQFSLSELPILLLITRDHVEDKQTGFLMGANDFVTKPIDALELTTRIYALITLKQSINEQLNMEAARFQAQISPQFLVQILERIIALHQVNVERMNSLLQAFAKYLRFSYQQYNTQASILLEKEIKHTYVYRSIIEELFGHRISIHLDLDPIQMIDIPPRSILTIVEHVIKEHILSSTDNGTVEIKIKNNPHAMKVTIHDSGRVVKEEKFYVQSKIADYNHANIRIVNTNKRLLQMYGTGMYFERIPNKGTKISFEIPFIPNPD